MFITKRNQEIVYSMKRLYLILPALIFYSSSIGIILLVLSADYILTLSLNAIFGVLFIFAICCLCIISLTKILTDEEWEYITLYHWWKQLFENKQQL